MSGETEMLKQRRKDLEHRLNEATVERQNAQQYVQQMTNEIVGLARAISEFDEIVKVIEQLPRAPMIDNVPEVVAPAPYVEVELGDDAHADQATDR